MDYQSILIKAESKLSGPFDYIIRDIKELVSIGSTGGEISSMVGEYLTDLKDKNISAYSLLEKEIQSYLLDCKKNGLIIR